MGGRPPSLRELKNSLMQPAPNIPKVRFRKIGKFWGLTFCESSEIHLHLSYLDRVIGTWVHEKIHLLYPELSEADVLRLEKRFMSKATIRDKVKMFKELAMLL